MLSVVRIAVWRGERAFGVRCGGGAAIALVAFACANCGPEFGCEDPARCVSGRSPDTADAGEPLAEASLTSSDQGGSDVDSGRRESSDSELELQDAAPSADVANDEEPDGGSASYTDAEAGRDDDTGASAADARNDAPPLDCDFAAPPKVGCVPPISSGVFVSQRGDNLNSGTPKAPFLTIAHGLSEAKKRGLLDVYVCGSAGSYRTISIGADYDGFRLHGGFDCGSWQYSDQPDRRTRVEASADENALRIDHIATSLVIEDFSFVSPAATQPGKSSIAGFVLASAGVRLSRVRLEAGAGADGPDGVAASNWSESDPRSRALRGHAADDPSGAQAQACLDICADGQHGTGGAGGPGGLGSTDPQPGGDGTPSYPTPDPPTATGSGGLGAKGTLRSAPAPGADGSNGPSGCGGPGAAQRGFVDASGWHPASGLVGSSGKPGQGGGGGGGPALGGSGGGGACGGCGGAGGPGGAGGGSSFALLSFNNSSIKLDSCVLIAGAAGKGGRGADGQAGQPGGLGGAGTNCSSTQTDQLCSGGDGGSGGGGGGGGGGAGGLSVALAFAGPAPYNTSGEWAVAARGGAGGAAGEGAGSVASASDGGICLATSGKEGIARMALNLDDGE